MAKNKDASILIEGVGGNCYVAYQTKARKYLLFREKPSLKEVEDSFEKEFKKEKKYKAKIPFRTLVVNLTEQCNLRCIYCHRYKKDYDSSSSMSEEVLALVIKRASEHAAGESQKIVVQFHGGEPTLRFKQIKRVLDNNKNRIKNLDLRIQTNATNISREFIEFCKLYNIQVGVSLDGPPHLTSIVRKYGDDRSIFPKVEKNIELIRENIPRTHISCLCVMSSVNVKKAEEVFDYLINNQHIDDVSFLPLYPDFSPCLNRASSQIIPRDKEMAEFSKEIFNLWIEALKKGKKIFIPSFQIWFWHLAALNRGAILPNTWCGVGETMVFIDTDGTYYPCSPLSYEKSMIMGNVRDNKISEISKSKVGELFSTRNTKFVSECQECAYQGICMGGCPANAFLQKRDLFKKDPFCDYWKEIISYILRRVAEEPKIFNLIPEYTLRF